MSRLYSTLVIGKKTSDNLHEDSKFYTSHGYVLLNNKNDKVFLVCRENSCYVNAPEIFRSVYISCL